MALSSFANMLRLPLSVSLAALCLIAQVAAAQSNWAVAPSDRGAMDFCDIDRDTVWHFDPSTGLNPLFDHNHCHVLVRAYDGQLYGENVGGESRAGGLVGVWRLTPDGHREFLLSPTANPDPSIWVARDALGNMYAWDGNPESRKTSRLLKRTPQGDVRTLSGNAWGRADGAAEVAQFGQVAALAAQPDGTLYVVDDGDVRRIETDGRVSTLARGLFSPIAGGLPGIGGLYNHHMGIAVEADGAIYVVDYGRKHIVRWESSAGARVVFESRGIGNWLTGGGWGWRPTGVAVEKNSILVMEEWSLPRLLGGLVGDPRIFRVAPDGNRSCVVAVRNWPARITLIALAAGGLLIIFRRRNRKLHR
jgi:sugar lactone lactonase YvrE